MTLGDEKGKCPLEVGALDQRKPPPGEQTPPTGRVGTAALTAFGLLYVVPVAYMPPLVPLLVLGSAVPAGLFSDGSAALGL